jgi:hypothetical protein
MPQLASDGSMLVVVRVYNPATGRSASGTFRIDTGDDTTIVDPLILGAIGAMPIGSQTIEGVDGQPVTDNLYRVDLDLGASGYVPGVTVVGQDLSGLGLAGLIGDNLLAQGVLVRDGPAGTFSLTVAPPIPTASNVGATVAALAALAGGVAIVAALAAPRS